MPGVLNRKEGKGVAEAIQSPPDPGIPNGESNAEIMPQPRQPTSLHGLLRFAMEATKSEDAPSTSNFQAMDQERQQFLEQALRSVTIDITQVLKESIEVLKSVDSAKSADDVTKQLKAIDSVLEYIDQIDIANDFQKLGGIEVLWKCLCSEHTGIRTGACDIVAELCQNNPYCQKFLTENRVISCLVGIIENNTSDKTLVTKALHAISALIRENMDALRLLRQNRGVSTLLKALQQDEEKWNSKICFLLSAMCHKDRRLLGELVAHDYVPVLIELISRDKKTSHEHLLLLLADLVQGDERALQQCLNSRFDFKQILKRHLEQVAGKPEFDEERQYCNIILEAMEKSQAY